ncbi:OsmC family protein [Terriglobus tenax]|uniref:OsmC family protein n=1 Tax=Terriglobus tenax TaxID=1111115 RepID=UPI0021E04BF3|nr:OsmC family protein [Terriglobus tenax]
MIISARVTNEGGRHHTVVRTGGNEQAVAIAAKAAGSGSSVNGGELLFLALATCYCNDIYREAAERGIDVQSIEVEVTGRFGGKGEPAQQITYRAAMRSTASEEEALALMHHTDSVAEIHNTLRQGMPVTMTECRVL